MNRKIIVFCIVVIVIISIIICFIKMQKYVEDNNESIYISKNNSEYENTQKKISEITELVEIEEYGEKAKDILENETQNTQKVEFIKMYFKENSFTTQKATVVMVNNSSGNFLTDPFFRLDKFEDNEWKTVASWGTYEIATIVPPNETIEFKIDWVKEYKELEEGTYRLVKRKDSLDDFPIYENLTLEFEV